MRLTLVRHGETTGQSSIRYYGRTDVALSELGVWQMKRVREALAGEPFAAVFSSRLKRSRLGASLVAGDGHPVTPIAAFDEIDFGRWEGWTRGEIERLDPENYRRWQANGSAFTYPGGEARPDFERRVGAALDELLATLAAESVLMVLHKGVIAVILTRLLGLDSAGRRRLGIDLASIHALSGRDGRWRAECLNRTDHLHDRVGVAP